MQTVTDLRGDIDGATVSLFSAGLSASLHRSIPMSGAQRRRLTSDQW